MYRVYSLKFLVLGRLRRVAAVAVLGALMSAPAQADVSEARRLLDEGRAAQALRIIDDRLASSPQDAELRFLRGLALSRVNRHDEAIDVFASLTRDYPQLPEPYNNLAVIHAQQGDYESARDALESALATHPSYATAHENLGDIYAALASASYNRALLLDSENPQLRGKLRLMNQLGSAPDTAPARIGEGTPRPAAPSRPDATEAPPAAAPTPTAPTTAEASPADRERISAAVFDWAEAWAGQNVEAYLAKYAPDFTPAGGVSRGAWESQRRERISNPQFIRVRVRDPEIQIIDATRARVTFRQEYESDTFQNVTTKMLDLRRVGDRWLILRETSS